MRVRLTVIGCSPAWPNPGGAHSGYLVEHEGHRLLLDCGPGVLPRMRQAEAWPEIDAIAITHFHLDHWGDVVPWVWGALFRRNGTGRRRPELWVHPNGVAHLADFGERFGGVPNMFDLVFDVHQYPAEETVTVQGNVKIYMTREFRLIDGALMLVKEQTLVYTASSVSVPEALRLIAVSSEPSTIWLARAWARRVGIWSFPPRTWYFSFEGPKIRSWPCPE